MLVRFPQWARASKGHVPVTWMNSDRARHGLAGHFGHARFASLRR
jgi:hypothetical protein